MLGFSTAIAHGPKSVPSMSDPRLQSGYSLTAKSFYDAINASRIPSGALANFIKAPVR